jgi:hypothetical protein
LIDEARVSNVARSADWIATEYNNHSSPSTFYSIGTPQGLGGGQVATPTFSPTPAVYSSSQSVTISTTTTGASIRYTLDGSTPTSTTGTVYGGAINVNGTITIRAIAYMSGAPDSAVASATYTIGSGPAWYDTSWSNRKAITIDHTKVSGSSSLSNFPMLFSLTDANLRTVPNGGATGKNDGTDLLFTSSDGMTKLDDELESYNPGTGNVIAWVRIPTLSNTTDTVIYLYYGNASAIDQQNKTGVWDSNYQGVYHLPNGSSLSVTDSTSHNNGGVDHGATAAPAEIDGGASFNSASSQYVDFGNPSSLQITGALTIEAWVKFTGSFRNGIYPGILSKFSNSPYNGYELVLAANDAGALSNKLYLQVANGGTLYTAFANNAIAANTWYHVVAVYNGSVGNIYINGSAQSSSFSASSAIGATSGNLHLGHLSAESSHFWDGLIDEARVSNVARSADWIATEYNNHSSPSTFYSVGSQSSP